MIRIGDFAKMFNISINKVRFYEEKGLIIPAFTDQYSGYRYFDEENVSQMSKILFLKDLGLSLDDIRVYDDSKIDDIIKNYETKISELNQDIKMFNSIEQKGGIGNMKIFINDEKVIGKWKLIGISESKENYYQNKLLDDDFSIKELYLMEKGKTYWVVGWTKGFIIINGKESPYELEDDLMFVKVYGLFDDSEYKYAIYKKVDNNKYNIEDIAIKDNTNFKFIIDNKLTGNWQAIDYVNNKEQFVSQKRYWKYYMAIDKLSVYEDGNVLISYIGDRTKKTNYTNGVIANVILDNTLCKYTYKEENDKIYLFVEWKNGDYVYGHQISGYYVFEKTN